MGKEPKLIMKYLNFKISLLAIILILNFGCSPISIVTKTETCKGSWLEWGKLDAKSGKSAGYFKYRFKACKDKPKQMAKREYLKGKNNALRKYCAPKLGLMRGKKGKPAFEHCPQKLKRPYFELYALGLKEYQMRKKINELEKKISKLKGNLKDLPPLTQKRKFKQIEGLYLEKRKWAQNLKEFLISKKVN